MKKILVLFTFVVGLLACENQDIEFPDFDYTTGYFPYQYPVRTLILGDYIYDNTNDNNHSFLISAAMGGVYSNSEDREFEIELATELCSNVLFEGTNDTLRLMPENYYSLSSSNKLTIPSGNVNGGIEVQLTDAFFDDPLAIKLSYVIPVRIKNVTNLDSVLRGIPSIINPDPRVASQWIETPKDFTMFAVKYINPYHGNYLRRGSNVVKDPSGNIIEENVYRTSYIVDNEILKLTTTGKDLVSLNSKLSSNILTGDLTMDLSFRSDGNCNIIKGNSGIKVGTGKFVKDGDEWGGKKRNVIILSYNYPVEYIAPPLPPERTEVDDLDGSINYFGKWVHGEEGNCYNGTKSYLNNAGDYFTFDFTGDGIELYFKTGPNYGSCDVYIDNVKVGDDISLMTAETQYNQKVFETTFPYGNHTTKIVIKAPGKYAVFDYLAYTQLDPPTNLQSGKYTFEANDTLVIRDRAVSMEVFKPVVIE